MHIGLGDAYMTDYNKTAYNREYNKTAYKTVKVYIPTEDYPAIEQYIKGKGYKVSEYLKILLEKDMKGESEHGDT